VGDGRPSRRSGERAVAPQGPSRSAARGAAERPLGEPLGAGEAVSLPARALTHREAREFYDRFGARQDLQRVYEDPALRVLEAYAQIEHAHAVVEFGCGTGRLARRLLARRLGREASYLGLDLSSTMVALAREKLAPWAERARVLQTEGQPILPLPDACCDLFVSTYVLDLLSTEESRAVIAEARRVLVPGGRLCLASLTFGHGALSRGLCRLWTTVHGWRPRLVGGCRPIRLLNCLGDGWQVIHREVVCTLGLCTEVLVARPDRR
jgi:ubiquinone/menaquinone biosynthesis C-methylase UbiE